MASRGPGPVRARPSRWPYAPKCWRNFLKRGAGEAPSVDLGGVYGDQGAVSEACKATIVGSSDTFDSSEVEFSEVGGIYMGINLS